MIRLQDIADMVGVSRTTVSNVMHGKTKKVSQETIKKISAILNEQGYVPNMGSMILSSNVSKIIGIVLGYSESHGFYAAQDPFVGEFIGAIEKAAEDLGYFVMLIGGEKVERVVDIASRWNIDGLLILGYPEQHYRQLRKKLNKPIVLIDTYPSNGYDYYNVGIDDHSGGKQIGEYLLSCGFTKAVFIAETQMGSDYYRWLGFKQGMESRGGFCSKSRYVVVPNTREERAITYRRMLPFLLEAKALAFTSDYNAMEAMNFFYDNKINVPEQISITGFDDNMYAHLVRPRLTTVRQEVSQKAVLGIQLLMKIIHNEPIEQYAIKNPVKLILRDSVKPQNKINVRTQ